MRYLKIFESFNRDKYWDDYLDKLNSDIKKSKEESEKDYSEYYRMIDDDELKELIFKRIDFEKKEIEKITSLFPDSYEINVSQWQNLVEDNTPEYRYHVTNYIRAFKKIQGEIYIFKLPDEYYLVGIGDEQVKIYDLCDQFDGLKLLIRKVTTNIFETNTHKVNESTQDEFYQKLTQSEFDELLANPNINSLSKSDISILLRFADENDSRLALNDATIYIYEIRNGWFISDCWGLDKYIDSDHIKINGKDHYSQRYTLDDELTVENFTARLYSDESREYNMDHFIDIMKCEDEWFLISWEDYRGNNIMYKCDQIEGVIKFLEHEYT